ncbi:MAG: RNA polymerase sigma factor [Myxococcales bacterium]|nr:RNA polymerase sigma factor [Myxococcales bacterium]
MIAAAAGDRAAFGVVVERYSSKVFHLARALVRDDATAEDVLQDTFLAAWRTAAAYRGDGAVASWLYAIARNGAHRRGRRADQIATDDRSLEALGAAAGWGAPDLELVVTRSEDRAALEAALATLPPDDRAAIWLHHMLEQSFDDTARVLACSVPAVKSRLHRARLTLAAALRQGGYDGAR